MFKVNDYVMYGTTGVCKITEIKKVPFKDVMTDYYVMHPVFEKSTSKIMIPVENTTVKIRKISTKDKVMSLINKIPSVNDSWTEDKRQRNFEQKKSLASCSCEEWIKLLKTLWIKREEAIENNKKLPVADEAIFTAAEKLLYQEFSVALDIPIEDVTPFIEDKLA